ncbi:YciI family protein [Phyllobacterium sp. TAF24]|uniref:YciI family protein n=1 Tax=Phyllobacterium sp. TAF24 TaxID=3233068 RepID=UPI003F9C19F3
MEYLCLVYFDEKMLADRSDQEKATLGRESKAYDEELAASGHLILAHALERPSNAVTVRVRHSKMSTTDGPFAETKEILGGFILITAADLNEAIRIGAGIPLAKLGSIEVRPIMKW